MNKIAISPLKIILFGEHSVLIGGRCIAVCINKYCDLYLPDNFKKETSSTFLIKDITNNKFLFTIEKDSNDQSTKDSNEQFKIEKDLNKSYNGIINVNYQLGCGLGSSAAISILSAIALVKRKTINFYDKNISRENILKSATLIEDFFHGKSSGVDCATLKHGGMISFKNKKVEKMSFNLLQKYKLVIFNSCIPKDTKKCVKQSLNNKEENYKKLSEVSEDAYLLLKNDFILTDLYKLIKKAQEILEDLGVVPQLMKNEVNRLRKIGIESKITGAGNGGHLFTLIEKNVILENWEEVSIDKTGFLIN